MSRDRNRNDDFDFNNEQADERENFFDLEEPADEFTAAPAQTADDRQPNARDRIQQMRREQSSDVQDRRRQQRTLYGIVAAVLVVVVVGSIIFLLLPKGSGGTQPGGGVASGSPRPLRTGTAPAIGAVKTMQVVGGEPTATPNAEQAIELTPPGQIATVAGEVATAVPGNAPEPTPVDLGQPRPPANSPAVQPAITVAATQPPAPPSAGDSGDNVRQTTAQAGDILTTIAQREGVSVAQLMAANNEAIRHPQDLQAGQKLKVPGKNYAPASLTWNVRGGDNLTRISNQLGVTVERISSSNADRIGPDSTIYPGTDLIIPLK